MHFSRSIIVLIFIIGFTALAQEATEPSAPPTLTETPSLTPIFTATASPSPTETATLPVIQTPPAEVTTEPSPEIIAEVTPEVTVEVTAETTAEATEALPPTETATATATLTATASQTALPPEPALVLLSAADFTTPLSGRDWDLPAGWMRTPSGIQALSGGEEAIYRDSLFTDVALEARFLLEAGAFTLNARGYTAVIDLVGTLRLYRGEVELASTLLWTADGGWHTLRLSTVGSVVRVAVDDIEVLVLYDAIPTAAGLVTVGGYRSAGSLFYLQQLSLRVSQTEMTVQAAMQGVTGFAQPPVTLNADPAALPYVLSWVSSATGASALAHVDVAWYDNNTQYIQHYTAYNASSDVWSPNGMQLAVTTHVSGSIYIATLAIDGSTFTTLSDQAADWGGPQSGFSDTCPSWSPDGSQIAFRSTGRDPRVDPIYVRSGIYTIAADRSSVPRRLVLSGGVAGSVFSCPLWSPVAGSQEILFLQRDENNLYALYVIHAQTLQTTKLFNWPVSFQQQTWSPDGTKIAFVSTLNNVTRLYVYHRQTGIIDAVTDQYSMRPSWHPDSTRLIYYAGSDGLGIASAALVCPNCTRTLLAGGSEFDYTPRWSPDGNWIVVDSARDSNAYEIYLIAAGGSGAVRVTNDTVYDSSPAWNPQAYLFPVLPPTPTPTPPPICSNVQQLQVNGIYMMNEQGDPACATDMLAEYGVVPEGAWTDEQIEAMLIGVQNIGLVAQDFSTQQNITPQEAFKSIMLIDPTHTIIFRRLATAESYCTTNAEPNAQTNVRATIECGTGNNFKQYTAVHELGHVFMHQSVNDDAVDTSVTPCTNSEGVVGFIYCMEDPDPSNNNFASLGRGPSGTYIFGSRGAILLQSITGSPNSASSVEGQINIFDPNNEYMLSANSSVFQYVYCSNGRSPSEGVCPDDRPPVYANLLDWYRGSRGWDGEDFDPPGPCADADSEEVSDFQQNPCNLIDWIVDNSPNPEIYGDTLLVTEIEEASSDMFLNWIYRYLQLGGFINDDQIVIGRFDDLGSMGPGDDRFYWMTENLAIFWVYYGW